MSPQALETTFQVAQLGVLPLWALLAFAPRWRGTQLLVHSALAPLLYGALYSTLLLTCPFADGGGFSTLAGVWTLFSEPHAVLVGWVHYLVLDLMLGAWVVRDAHRRQIPHLVILLILPLNLLVAPVGLLVYVLLRGLWTGAWTEPLDTPQPAPTV